MGGVARAELVGAVSNAGALGMLGMIRMVPSFIREQIRRTRALTDRPFGVNIVPGVVSDADFAAQIDVEAGGHVRGEVGLLPLLPTVADAVPSVPVIAAGGIVDGRGLAAALALGADGVWVGTRFLASEESEAHPDYKKRLLGATEIDTVHTETFHVGWPPQSPHRVLRSSVTDGSSQPAGPVARVRQGERITDVPAFSSAAPTVHTQGRTELMANYAGQGVGLIHDILPAAEIVERMVAEADTLLRRLPTMLT